VSNGWRYIAQRIDGRGGTGNFLDFNVPLEVDSIEDVLSGHNGLTGTISPEVGRMLADDGQPLIVEGQTAIWAEDPDGNIVGGGLVTHCDFDGPMWSIECSDLSFTSVETPYTDSNVWINVDPIDLFRHIWTHMQSQNGGNLGITMDGTRSPIRLGGELIQRETFDTEADPSAEVGDDTATLYPFPAAPNPYANNGEWKTKAVKVLKARNWNADAVEKALTKWLNKDSLKSQGKWTPLTDREARIKRKAVELIGWPPSPPTGEGPMSQYVNVRPQMNAPDSETVDPTTGEPRIHYDYDAYRLAWYETFDLSATVDDLASATPFDWHMVHWWEGEEIRHHIRIGYPKLGRTLSELRFVIGENVRTIPKVSRDGTRFATELLVLGAGEGSAMIRGRAFRDVPDQVRLCKVISAPWIKSESEANNYAQRMMAAYARRDDVEEIELLDHPHAPVGAVSIGDEFLLEGDTGWVDIETMVRVVSRSINPATGAVTLGLLRTDRVV
jgi:hypothetical protein